MSIKSKAVSGVKWTSTSTVVASSLQFIQVAVLARFLNKADFGLMAIALFVIGISQIFLDMGISNALIHKQQVNRFQLSTLFWANIVLGVIIYGCVLISSPLITRFYDTPKLHGVINWVGVSFIILPWGQQFDALLRRDLRFKPLAVCDILSKVVGIVVAVSLAVGGFGVYALVYANLANSFVATLLLMFIGFRDYRPEWLFSYRSLKGKGILSFGLFQIGEKTLNYFTANFDTILIGKLLGMEALGVYNIAKVLAMKPFQILNPIITKVAFPVFAMVQNENDKLKRAYLKVVGVLTSANAPIYVCMLVLAKPLIHIAFGPEWQDAVPILQLLIMGSICMSIGNPVGSLQLAKGRADLGLYWNLALFICLPIIMWLGSFYGLIGVAFALAVSKIMITIFPAWYFFIKPLCGARLGEYFRSYFNPTGIAFLAGILPFVLSLGIQNNYLLLILGGVLYAVIYGFLSVKLNKNMLREIKELVPDRIITKLGLE